MEYGKHPSIIYLYGRLIWYLFTKNEEIQLMMKRLEEESILD
jgi:hypothetical protein